MAQKIITPKGEINWVFINGNPKKDLNGKARYVATLRLKDGSDELKEITDQIDTFCEDNKPKGRKLKSNGIRQEVDKEGNPTGYTNINMWTGITRPDGKEKVIKVYNAKNNEVSLGSKKIGNGSIGRLSGVMDIYDSGVAATGVTLYLNAIQLTKFVEFSSDDFGDVAEEDGWTGDEGTEFDDSSNGTEVADSDAPKIRL